MGLILKNESKNIPDAYFNLFVDFAIGDVVMVINPKELQREKRAVTVSFELKNFPDYYSGIMKSTIYQYDLNSFDSLIFIPKSFCDEYPVNSAFLSYVIGHELGHGKIIKEDITNHILSCLIQEKIAQASNCIISKWYQLPHEKLCDRYGIFVAERIYSREKLNKEIKRKLKNNEEKNPERLTEILSYESTDDFSNLRKMLIEISWPYKQELIRLWNKEREKDPQGIAHSIDDYEELFI